MKDWSRYEEAKRLRDSGMTYKDVGERMGVSSTRAREMVISMERKLRWIRFRAENPKPKKWYEGLSFATSNRLHECGFSSREDCLILAKDDLQMFNRCVVLPWWETDRGMWRFSNKKLSLKVVNEVRLWLGVKEFVPKARVASHSEIERARRLLESHGYKVL